MFHELLLALSGLSGDLFIPYPPAPENPVLFKIPPDFPFLHQAERTSLERLAILGFHYRAIVIFLDSNRGRNVSTTPRGSFVYAFCNAVNDALSDYKKLVIETEKKVLNKDDTGGFVSISHLTSVFAVYHIILPQLHNLVKEINANSAKYYGAGVLNLLVDRCNTGVPELREIMLKLVHACHRVMYQYVTSWMVYGNLQDIYREFFIKEMTVEQQQSQISTNLEEFSQTRWHQRFTIDESLIPKYIPISTAESILFVGRAIATVRYASKTHSHQNNRMLPRNLSAMHLEYLLKLSSNPIFNPLELENVVNTIRNNVAQWLWQVVLTGDKVIACLESFRNYFLLGQGDFALSLVEQFEKLANSRLNSTRASLIKEPELNSLLIRASVGTLAENDLTLEKFKFKLGNQIEQSNLQSINFDDIMIGTPLRFEYDINWPLDLFVTSEDLSKYGTMFSFLISLKRTQYRLHKAWIHLSAVHKYDLVDHNRKIRSLIPWKLRASMVFFVECILGHVQMDIIESNFQKLIHQIRVSSAQYHTSHSSNQSAPVNTSSILSATQVQATEEKRATNVEALRDFEEIRLGHTSYLNDVLRGCLLESRTCAETIKRALSISDRICGLLERWDGRLEDGENLDQIIQLGGEFREQATFLFRTLSGVNKTADGFGGPPRHLDQLLLRMDYSKWFSVWIS